MDNKQTSNDSSTVWLVIIFVALIGGLQLVGLIAIFMVSVVAIFLLCVYAFSEGFTIGDVFSILFTFVIVPGAIILFFVL